MDIQRALAAVLLAVVVVAAIPAVVALTTTVPVGGDVPVTTDDTPTITLGTNSGADELDLTSFFQGTELDIDTPNGNITISGDSGASARLELSDIEGQQTQVTQIDAGANWLNLNPDDKQRVDVRGDVDTLSFQSVGVNDGATDLQLGGTQGGSAELRIYDLQANTEYVLYDPNAAVSDRQLATGTTDGSGTLQTTAAMPDGTQTVEVRTADDFRDPQLSNPDPTGNITERPTELSVDATAEAFPAVVNITYNGTQVHSETITQNQTVNTSITVDTLGSYDWSATIEDDLGQTDSVSESFTTPTNITFREEHNATQFIDNTTVTVRFFTTDGDIAIERQATNGTIDMEGLPNSAFVVFAQSDSHYDRSIYVDSIFEQQTFYLLNSTAVSRDTNDAVRSRFIFEDLTGDFPQGDTTVQIQRAVDPDADGTSQYRSVAGDFWGASSEYEAILEYGVRYRLVVTNRETGEERIVGSHIPTEELTQTVRVAGVIEELQQGEGVIATAQVDAENNTLSVGYTDPVNKTDELRVIVRERGGNETEILNETVGGPLGMYQKDLALNDSQLESDYVAIVEANDGQRHRQAIPVGSGLAGLPVPVPQWLLSLLMVMSVTFVGALYGPRTALFGAWAMVFVAAGVAMFGWAFGWPSVIVAALVATGVTFLNRAIP